MEKRYAANAILYSHDISNFRRHMTNGNVASVILPHPMLGKPLSICLHLYLGIAQIAITPPPALKRAPWGTFFQARFYLFTIFTICFTIFSE